MSEIMDEISAMKGAYIIAEIGVNYYDIAQKENISIMDAAKLMIDGAVEAGCHAAKFQTYKAEKIASKNSPAYWDLGEEPTSSQYELFSKFDSFGEKEYKQLADYCRNKNIEFLSTPFDFDAADYLYELMPIYKISSSDITNFPFLRHIAKKGKPLILSTGAATLGEIESAVNAVKDEGNENVSLMHCILSYPTNYKDANLQMINHLKAVFPNMLIGFSDHTRPDESMLVLTTAYLYGAKIIEKHFTLDKMLKGNDHYHAMDISDCKKFISNLEMIEVINGEYLKKPLTCEAQSRKQARRSIVAAYNIPAGTTISKEMITYKRPGTGLPPGLAEYVIGRSAKVNIEEDSLFTWEMIG